MFEESMDQSKNYYDMYDVYDVDCDDGTHGDKIFIPRSTKVE